MKNNNFQKYYQSKWPKTFDTFGICKNKNINSHKIYTKASYFCHKYRKFNQNIFDGKQRIGGKTSKKKKNLTNIEGISLNTFSQEKYPDILYIFWTIVPWMRRCCLYSYFSFCRFLTICRIWIRIVCIRPPVVINCQRSQFCQYSCDCGCDNVYMLIYLRIVANCETSICSKHKHTYTWTVTRSWCML